MAINFNIFFYFLVDYLIFICKLLEDNVGFNTPHNLEKLVATAEAISHELTIDEKGKEFSLLFSLVKKLYLKTLLLIDFNCLYQWKTRMKWY